MATVAPTLWINDLSALFELTKSAEWAPVKAWETDDAGKRRPSENQAKTASGLLIWEIRAIGSLDSYGRSQESFVTLRVASSARPTRQALEELSVAK